MTRRFLKCVFTSLIAGAALLIAGCFGDDVTPQNTNIAGKWQVACMPVNEDCPNFDIAFGTHGDITEIDLDGHQGAQRGTGEITDAVLSFSVGRGPAYTFSGKLNGAGLSASGSLTNFDFDGTQRTTPAVITRR